MRRRPAWWLVTLACGSACGGRFEQTLDGNTGGSAPSQAGSTGRAGGGSAGSVGGQTNSGGTVAAGGALNGGGSVGIAGAAICACDPIACAPGYLTLPNADGCCYHCELDLKSCEAQRQGYLALQQQLFEKYRSAGCKVASDCSIYYARNSCASSCGAAMPKVLIESLDSNLNSYAQMACNPACPPPPQIPCVPPSQPQCVKGYCQ